MSMQVCQPWPSRRLALLGWVPGCTALSPSSFPIRLNNTTDTHTHTHNNDANNTNNNNDARGLVADGGARVQGVLAPL